MKAIMIENRNYIVSYDDIHFAYFDGDFNFISIAPASRWGVANKENSEIFRIESQQVANYFEFYDFENECNR